MSTVDKLKKLPALVSKAAKAVERAAPKITALQDAVALEGRLFGGSYGMVLGGPFAPKGSPKYNTIVQGREQYNAARVEAGLPEVSDWRKRPEQLMQRLPLRSEAPIAAPQDEALRLAQQRATLPVKQGGLGLPADNTPEQRAAAMGFTQDAYHGTPIFDNGIGGNILRFNPNASVEMARRKPSSTCSRKGAASF